LDNTSRVYSDATISRLTLDEPLTNVNDEGDDELVPFLRGEMIRWIYRT
jgi:hypothetical protein